MTQMEKATFGIFVWRGDGRYKRSDAIKTYTSERAAHRFCEKHRTENYVVRSLNLIAQP